MRRFRTVLVMSIACVSGTCGGDDESPPVVAPDPDLQAPTAVVDVLSEALLEGQEIAFRVRSSDNRGLASRVFAFGDGESVTATLGGTADDDTLTHVYSGGEYTATVTYTDASGLSASASVSLQITIPEWATVAAMPFGVRYGAAASHEGRLYVFGGTNPAGLRVGHTQVFDPAAGTWATGADMPVPSDYVTAATSSIGIHVLGGHDGNGVVATHRLYDPDDASWSLLPAAPQALDGGSAQVVGGKLYLFGGTPGGRAWLDNVQIYDVQSGTWSAGTPIPGARISPTAVQSDGVIHLLGGGIPYLETSAEHWVYDPTGDSWSAGPGLPGARETLGAGVLNGWLCVFGGREARAGRFNTPFGDTYCLEPGTSSWRIQADMPTPRAELASATLDGWIYAVGGHDDQDVPQAVVERFRR